MTSQTILIVEDDLDMLELIAVILGDEGYRVLQAPEARAALSVLETMKPDLIVSDVSMPGMDGFGLLERVRAKPDLAPIPFVFLTGWGERAHMRRGMELGADDYLTKPFEADELLSAVRIRLARSLEARAAAERTGDDLKRMIVRILTHELRTPMALMFGYTELLEATGPGMSEEDLRVILQGLSSGTDRLKTLAENLLLLSRLQSGLFREEIQQICCRTDEVDWVVSQTVESLRGRASARGTGLVVHPGTPRAVVAINEASLAEIVRQLADNAIKFSTEGGQVALTTRQDGAFWILEVADTGVGICQDALPWIFEAFRQVDRDRLEQQGAGLGLAIVHGLVDTFGGRVAVQSEPGVGSTFTVCLPLAPTRSLRNGMKESVS